MTRIVTLQNNAWDKAFPTEDQFEAMRELESGNVLWFPQLGFPVAAEEASLFSSQTIAQAKNISLEPVTQRLKGIAVEEPELSLLKGVVKRFADASRQLVKNLLGHYDRVLTQARTSYRPVEIAGRLVSWRKDDTRLHVDSFPSSPTQGKRILRVFTNVNPHGHNRVWRVGEAFETVVERFASSLPPPKLGVGVALNLLGITKTRRSRYDHYMLNLHDAMKADTAYQKEAPQRTFEFPPGSSWIVFTDQVSHAAMQGQYLLEQTFLVPVAGMLDPKYSPLQILERRFGRSLA